MKCAKLCTAAAPDGTEQALALVCEREIEIVINGGSILSACILPGGETEFLYGHLYTEGLIRSTADVQALQWNGDRAAVTLLPTQPPQHTDAPVWTAEDIRRLFDRLQTMPVYRQTHSAHSCILMHRDNILYCMEDIGRHNAFDKAVGLALLHGVDPAACIAFSSGRLPVCMIRKAAHAGIRVLASKSLPTAQAVTLARECNITLLHYSRRLGLLQFSDGENTHG